MLPERVVGSDETALWRTVLDQAMQDACAKPRSMPNPDDPEKAHPDFALVCDFADLEPSVLCKYAQDVISNGRRR